MRTAPILGVGVVQEDSADAVEAIALLAAQGGSGYICVGNAHQYVLASTDETFREILKSSTYNVFDSQVVAFALRLKHGRRIRVMRGLELTLSLCALAERKALRVGFYGTSIQTLRALRTSLQRLYPKLDVAYAEAPGKVEYERITTDHEVCAKIRDAGVQLLFVGLGCPKQEKWMYSQRLLLSCTQIGVGAAFDYIAQVVPPPPLWVHRCGLEWAYRLCMEPRRLWQRYLITNTMFLWYFAKDLLSSRRG